MQFEVFGFEVTAPVLTLGAITGMTYGLMAVGLVLIYRSNRIINFAHGEVGAFGAALLGLAVVHWSVPYWIAFPLALAASAATGAVAEVAVVRRLRKAPSLMSIVGTLGVAQVLLLSSFLVNSQVRSSLIFPQPSGLPEFQVGALRVTKAYFAMLVLTPVLVTGLAIFLRKSWFGLAIRGSAANPDAARMAGIFSSRMSTLSWAIAGALSAFTAVLILPARGFVSAEALGPGLLLRALVGAVVARMKSLPVALVTGIGVGIVEQELLWNYPRTSFVEMIMFIVVLIALLLQPRHAGRGEDSGSWTAVQPWPPLPAALLKVWAIRNLGRLVGATVLLIAIVLPAFMTNSAAIIFVATISFALVGISLGIISGLAGQLSLGQFALAGIGAAASFHISSRTGNYLLGFAAAGATAALVSTAIGLPALRIRGLMLAVTTLSFALVAQIWLFQQPWMLADGVDPGRPKWGPINLDTGKKYYFAALLLLGLAILLARNVWRTGLARRLVALRDNEDGARAFTVPSTLVKLQAFALAGFLAGLGGALYGHALSRITPQAFPVGASINVVAMTVLGGIGILTGPLIGALYIIGVPQFLPLDSAGLAASALGWLLLILYFPGGIAQLIAPLRKRAIDWLARWPRQSRSLDETVSDADPARALGAGVPSLMRRPAQNDGLILEAQNLRKQFGGLVAVNDVSLQVRRGETLGLIGPNGAGKTTLFELLGGFTKADAGRVIFGGRDVTSLGPESRAMLGLIRSFQDASLFPTMTVLSAVQLAFERIAPTRFFGSLAGFSTAERQKQEQARDLISLMGLDDFRDRQISELSTGTRRIAELTCLVALQPSVLLLDEPSSGIAQRETEALGKLISRLKTHLDATLVVIEHDIPLIMSLADRIVAMESGEVLAEGAAEEIRHNPLVIASYLGGDVRAIERSGVTAIKLAPDSQAEIASVPPPKDDDGIVRCSAITKAGSRCSRRAIVHGLCSQHRATVKTNSEGVRN